MTFCGCAGERCLCATPLHEHVAALKKLGSITWYADPAGRTETEELRSAGLVVRAGDNTLGPGIAAVTAQPTHRSAQGVAHALPQSPA